MISPSDLLDFAYESAFASLQAVGVSRSGDLTDNPVSETAARKAVSTCYYALFHTVAEAGAALFRADAGQRQRIARSYEHGSVATAAKKLEKSYRTSSRLPPVDERLVRFGQTFVELRQLREDADYNLETTFIADDAFETCTAADTALAAFDTVKEHPDTIDFLLDALLRARRG